MIHYPLTNLIEDFTDWLAHIVRFVNCDPANQDRNEEFHSTVAVLAAASCARIKHQGFRLQWSEWTDTDSEVGKHITVYGVIYQNRYYTAQCAEGQTLQRLMGGYTPSGRIDADTITITQFDHPVELLECFAPWVYTSEFHGVVGAINELLIVRGYEPLYWRLSRVTESSQCKYQMAVTHYFGTLTTWSVSGGHYWLTCRVLQQIKHLLQHCKIISKPATFKIPFKYGCSTGIYAFTFANNHISWLKSSALCSQTLLEPTVLPVWALRYVYDYLKAGLPVWLETDVDRFKLDALANATVINRYTE